MATNNTLTGVAIMTTCAEIESGRTRTFLQRIADSGGCAVPCYLCVNRMPKDTASLADLPIPVTIENLDINPVEDIYWRGTGQCPTMSIPPMGYAAGPNIAFMKTMRRMAAAGHNTILLLETDCKFGPAWFERLAAYVAAAGNFWIAGALYDGHVHINNPVIYTHINGVALYKVGSAGFQRLIDEVEKYIQWTVRHSDGHIAYDTAIRLCIDHHIEAAKSPADWLHWRYVSRCLIPTQLIVNASCAEDAAIPEKEFQLLYNYAILHQKDQA
jgi:hypothetical protein